jgi:hypothetical protein
MNIKALNKLESGWIKLDWSEWLNRKPLKDDDLMSIVDIIDIFKSNRQAKEVVIMKLKFIPAYVTIRKEEYVELLDNICQIMIDRELYEGCNRIMKIKEKLCSNLKKS